MDAPVDLTPLALHAESVPGDPTVLRWVLPEGLLPAGQVVGAPGPLGAMLAPAGPIVRALAERGALWTWLAGDDWSQQGPAVRDAIAASAADPDGWQIEACDDEVLGLVARDVIERSMGAYIASHGGRISLLAAADGCVEVDLGGACAHCPAIGLTLHGRIEREISERLGNRVSVRAPGADDGPQARPSWLPRLLRR